MKLLKTLTLGVIAAATVGTASAAPTIIHITGSTAFRTGASIAIIDTLAGTTPDGGAGSTPVYEAYSDTSVVGASSQVFANGTLGASGTATIVVETFWSGSLAGVVDVAAGVSIAAFPDISNSAVQSAVNSGSINLTTYLGGSQLAAGYATTGGTVELAMSDSNKVTISKELATGALSGTLGSFSTIGALASAVGSSAIADAGTSDQAGGAGVVAVVPFEWVLGYITTPSYTAPTNISQQAARDLITVGYIPQALFTGGNSAADLANYFYLEGRNEDSGTRIGAFSESQFGVTASPLQYKVGDDATTLSPTLLYPVTPLNTEPQISWPSAGHSGYASGGNVAAPLGIANNGSTITFTNGKPLANTGSSYFIGYLGVTDAAKALAKNATALTYNGIAYSPSAVQDGSYTFWTYEHAYRLASLSGTTRTVADEIADNVYYYDADVVYSTTSGVSHAENTTTGVYSSGSAGLFVDGFLNVSRSTTEGGPVTHN